MKRIALVTLLAFALFSCNMQPEQKPEEPESSIIYDNESGKPFQPGAEAYIPLNYTAQKGLWLPYMHFEDYMYGKSEEEYRAAADALLREAAEADINTVYFHVHPCGDAYYASDIFPRGVYYDGGYDPLKIMLDEAHALGISVHAWLNPLRCQTAEQMKAAPDDFIVKQWSEDPELGYVRLVGDRWYLDPAYGEVTELICACADELLNNYEIDGIHIDDYFYPTTDPDFDRHAFEESGSGELADWRRENCSRFVRALYETVKKHGARYKFGISPQGNIDADYNKQYADVALWGGTSGYCDYIVPQIYYGFKNETCPFEPTLRAWEDIVKESGVSLIVGLAAYKVGKEDKWAGASGENEWIDSDDIIERQIEVTERSSANGYALYY